MTHDNAAKALEAIDSIGCSATWHIRVSSEGCKIEIGGFPVLVTFKEPLHTFYEGPTADFATSILKAADAYELACYPERGTRWLESTP